MQRLKSTNRDILIERLLEVQLCLFPIDSPENDSSSLVLLRRTYQKVKQREKSIYCTFFGTMLEQTQEMYRGTLMSFILFDEELTTATELFLDDFSVEFSHFLIFCRPNSCSLVHDSLQLCKILQRFLRTIQVHQCLDQYRSEASHNSLVFQRNVPEMKVFFVSLQQMSNFEFSFCNRHSLKKIEMNSIELQA